jgi:O-antigen/teichoic acid export membrane protein
MCVWVVIWVFCTNQSCLMGATFRVGKQAISSVLSAVVNLALSILWIKTMGTAGVILATIVSYLIFIVAVQSWEVRRILRGDFLAAKQQPEDDTSVADSPPNSAPTSEFSPLG